MPEYIICKPTRLAPTTVHSHCEYMRRRRAATFVKDATNKIVLESGLDLSDELKDYAIRSLTDSAKKLFSKHSVKDLLEKPASIIGEIEQVREPPLRDIYIDLYPKDINDEPGLWVGTHHESDEGPLPGFEVITYFWTGQRMLFTGASWQEWEKALHSERESNIHHKLHTFSSSLRIDRNPDYYSQGIGSFVRDNPVRPDSSRRLLLPYRQEETSLGNLRVRTTLPAEEDGSSDDTGI